MPSLIFITDQKAQPLPEKVIENLPENAMVILRDYGHETRAQLGEAIGYVCKQRNIKFLIAKDLLLVHQLEADGIHLPEFMIDEASAIRAENENLFISVSCHSKESVLKAHNNGVDAILLAPVFATDSHPETYNDNSLAIGSIKTKEICASVETPVYALGGVNSETAMKLQDTGVTGIAAIRGLN